VTPQLHQLYGAVIPGVVREIESRPFLARIARFDRALAAWRRTGFSGLLHNPGRAVLLRPLPYK